MTQMTRNEAAPLEAVREIIGDASAGKVFGTPVTRGDMTVLPVARVSGGGGGGAGTGPQAAGERESTGTGGGLGLTARPLGVFVIQDGRVGWRPAIDINKMVLGGQLVAVVALLTVRALIKARATKA